MNATHTVAELIHDVKPRAMMSVDDIANELACSSRHVRRLADAGKMPRPIKHYRSCFDRFFLDRAAAVDPRLSDHWDQWAVARWMNREEFAHRCDYRRYHSLMTQLPRRARHHLRTLDGESVSLVDVTACQPSLLGYLTACHTSHPPSARPLLPYVARFWDRRRGTMTPDVGHWIELCETRSIYRYFYDSIQRYGGPTTTTLTTANGRQVTIDLRTIHDAVVVPDSLADTAAELIREQFLTLGLRPGIRIERCRAPTVNAPCVGGAE